MAAANKVMPLAVDTEQSARRVDLGVISPLSQSFVNKRKRLSNVLIKPPMVQIREDYSFDIPAGWEYDPEWGFRNDIWSLVEHNVAVQLAQSRMIESVSDLRVRLGKVQWGITKKVGAVLLILRFFLNIYSATSNVLALPARNTGEDYNLARYICFLFEAIAVGIQAGMTILYLIAGLLALCCLRNRYTHRKCTITSEPFNGKLRLRRQQVSYFRYSSLFLERSASFSVLKYLPSVQTLQGLFAARKEIWLSVKVKWEKFRGLIEGYNCFLVAIALLVAFPLLLAFFVILVAIYIGPYILSPVAFVIKLRFQVNFVVDEFYTGWTLGQFFRLAAFINSIASMVNVEKIRQDTIYDYVTNGSDAVYSKEEVAMRKELETQAYLTLWDRFGAVRAYFLHLSLDSNDLQRMTKVPGLPTHLRMLTQREVDAFKAEDTEIAAAAAATAAATSAASRRSGGMLDGEQKATAMDQMTDKVSAATSAAADAVLSLPGGDPRPPQEGDS